MSKKRIALVTALVILVVAVIALFVSSIFKKVDAPTVAPIVEQTQEQQPATTEVTETAEPALAPLPADNKAAIESEISNIDQEINSAIETELDDLSDIETSL